MRISLTMKVLLSDSNLITSSKVGSILKSKGLEVLSATSWKKAKELIEDNPDVEVAVINLEGMRGIEVLEGVKKEFPGIKVIAYCGHKNIHLQQKARELGAEAVVPNSVIVTQVVDIISQLTS